MRYDYLGNPVTADGDATLSGIDDFVGGFLGYEARALKVLAAAEADPENCLANAYAAALAMLGETERSAVDAAPYLARALAAAPGASAREQSVAEFVARWQADDIPAALTLAEEHAARWPRDLALVKLHHYLAFNLGEAARMLRIGLAVEKQAADVPQLHGMLAFAYEQCHLIGDAERAAKRALNLTRKEPWAQHALAHVALTEGRIAEGAAFLDSVADTWTGLNSFMLTHLWWHRALFHLSRGELERALAIYDANCWGIAREYSQDQTGAVSLLARIEMAGLDVGARWQDLAPFLAARATDTVQPFLSLQYLYGLARAGRSEAETLLAAIERRARTAPGFVRPVWQKVALPAAKALAAHARGRPEDAVERLRAALPRLVEIGGSHAQRDLFELVYLDALTLSGRWSEAQQVLELRRRHDPDGVVLNRTLALAYDRLGLPAQAAMARARTETPPPHPSPLTRDRESAA